MLPVIVLDSHYTTGNSTGTVFIILVIALNSHYSTGNSTGQPLYYQ